MARLDRCRPTPVNVERTQAPPISEVKSDWWGNISTPCRTACIVGTGPSINETIHKIPPRSFTIALNCAISFLPLANLWMAFDSDVLKKPAFQNGLATYKGTKLFGVGGGLQNLGTYTFKFQPGYKCGTPIVLQEPMLFGGATVAGAAIQLCYFLGVKKVILFGIDMFGNKYCDGTLHTKFVPDQPWPQLERLDALVHKLQPVMEIVKAAGNVDCPVWEPSTVEIGPRIALLSMCHTKVFSRQTVINAVEQSYEAKRLYILHQNETEDVSSLLPTVTACVDVDESVRLQFWQRKMEKFLEIVEEPYTAIWDCDDRYEYRYLEKCVQALQDTTYDGVWNYNEMMVTNQGFEIKKMPNAYGTMLIRTEVLKDVYNRLPRKSDSAMRKMLETNYRMGEHSAVRYYFNHPTMTSRDRDAYIIREFEARLPRIRIKEASDSTVVLEVI